MFMTERSQGQPLVIAHRGASAAATENSVAAFRLAAALGADMVELDVRRCADGILVVHHDARLSDGAPVAATRRSHLPATVPTLDEAIDACEGMAVNIEIKNDESDPGFEADRRLTDDVVALVERRRDDDRVLLSSFDRPSLDRVRALGASIATALLVSHVPSDVVTVLTEGGHGALHPWWLATTAALVERCHAADIAVNVWTCDDADAMRRLAGWGVDGICTNRPDLARAVIGPR